MSVWFSFIARESCLQSRTDSWLWPTFRCVAVSLSRRALASAREPFLSLSATDPIAFHEMSKDASLEAGMARKSACSSPRTLFSSNQAPSSDSSSEARDPTPSPASLRLPWLRLREVSMHSWVNTRVTRHTTRIAIATARASRHRVANAVSLEAEVK